MITMCPKCSGLNKVSEDKLASDPKCGKCQSPLFTGKPVEMNGGQLTRAMQKTDQLLIVDFWAPWCGPCKAFAPTFSQAAEQFKTQAKLIKINTEVEQAVGAQFNIRSIPSIVAFKNGKEVHRQAGALSSQQLAQFIAEANQH